MADKREDGKDGAIVDLDSLRKAPKIYGDTVSFAKGENSIAITISLTHRGMASDSVSGDNRIFPQAVVYMSEAMARLVLEQLDDWLRSKK